MLVSEATLASRAMRLREAEELVRKVLDNETSPVKALRTTLMLIQEVAAEDEADATKYARANR